MICKDAILQKRKPEYILPDVYSGFFYIIETWFGKGDIISLFDINCQNSLNCMKYIKNIDN